MAIVQCVDCDESICDCCEGEEVESGRYVCTDCADDRAEEDEEDEEIPSPRPSLSCRCGVTTSDIYNKNPGPMCRHCAHEYEIEIFSVGHDAATCPICAPRKKAA
jgi:hypothetical protein